VRKLADQFLRVKRFGGNSEQQTDHHNEGAAGLRSDQASRIWLRNT
jgi:hypothetical protein